jgi:phosphate starvation-inducible membrane PsiE
MSEEEEGTYQTTTTSSSGEKTTTTITGYGVEILVTFLGLALLGLVLLAGQGKVEMNVLQAIFSGLTALAGGLVLGKKETRSRLVDVLTLVALVLLLLVSGATLWVCAMT